MEKIEILIEYLKSMLEGTSNQRFGGWFAKHSILAKSVLSPPEFSRLKFKPVEFAENFLTKNGVKFNKNDYAVNVEKFLLKFSPEFIDENGNLKLEKLSNLYDGLVSVHESGNSHEIDNMLIHLLKKLNGNKDYLTQESLEFLYFLEAISFVNPLFSKDITNRMKRYFLSKGFVFSEIDAVLKRVSDSSSAPQVDPHPDQ